MQILQFISILACAMATAEARATLGWACSNPGTYDCTDGYGQQIAVCNGHWQLSADCSPGFCIWPAGYATPLCG
ncbi:hypothetical protein SAMD00023353_2000940 [Rosellinia necatrix]|uniref:Uncharacterized protein n=1 Tax=Rosellinia necatrix TaxID=77044 RepID=A0A1S8A7S4_ROSNE|nr:hypothetical protein SAMD00023353_2000940 [Rosellinia necatrix]